MLRGVQLTDTPAKIKWWLAQSGQYSTSSAYAVQFFGAFHDYNWSSMWKTRIENKCKVWAWLILQNRLKTVDRIIKEWRKCKSDINCVTHTVRHPHT
jgi:hypothetical protein